MKIDALAQKRFQELEEKAEAILGDRQITSVEGVDGKLISRVDQARATQCILTMLNLLQKSLGKDSVHFQSFSDYYNLLKSAGSIYESEFQQLKSIFDAAKEDFEGGYLFDSRALIQAEVLDDVLGQADILLKAGYKNPACVVAGVALEATLKELCTRNEIPLGKLDRMNADLAKTGIYNIGMQKQITAWADRRNDAAHGNWTNYTEPDVDDMIRGVTRLIAEYL